MKKKSTRWTYKKVDNTYLVKDKTGRAVCCPYSIDDARLISKAPDLLEALLYLVQSYPGFETGEEINGGDMIEHIGSLHGDWKKLVEEATGKKLKIYEETGNYFDLED